MGFFTPAPVFPPIQVLVIFAKTARYFEGNSFFHRREDFSRFFFLPPSSRDTLRGSSLVNRNTEDSKHPLVSPRLSPLFFFLSLSTRFLYGRRIVFKTDVVGPAGLFYLNFIPPLLFTLAPKVFFLQILRQTDFPVFVLEGGLEANFCVVCPPPLPPPPFPFSIITLHGPRVPNQGWNGCPVFLFSFCSGLGTSSRFQFSYWLSFLFCKIEAGLQRTIL